MNIDLSIIVPVYNVEDYIEECITSLLEIPIRNKEIIVVNDGSTDSSIDRVLKIDSEYIKVINQENAGLSAARNTGIKNANGDYILFIDSDDFIVSSKKIEIMLNTAKENNLDIILGNGYVYYSDTNKTPIFKDMKQLKNKVMDGKSYLKESIKISEFQAMVWLSIYKNSFIKENNFEFLEGYYHEDIDWTIKLMLKSKRVMYSNELFYIYRQRDGSIMKSKDYSKNARDMIEICLNNINRVEAINDDELRRCIYDEMLNTIFWVIMKAQGSNKNFIEEISVKSIPYKKANSKKTKLKFWLLAKNVRLAYSLNNIYEKLKK